MRHRIGMAVLVLFGSTSLASAQEPALDLIPHDAGAALAVHNIKELRDKGEKFYKEMNLRNEIKFSELFDQVFQFLGVQGVVEENAPAAVLFVSSKSIGLPPPTGIFDNNLMQLLVIVIPFKDRDRLGERLGFAKGELKAGEVQKVKKQAGFPAEICFVRNNHLYLGINEKAVTHAATAKKRFPAVLSAGQRQNFGKADVVLQLGTFAWGKLWEEGILKEARRVLGEKTDPREKDMAEKIVKAMEGIRFGLAGLHVEPDGLHLSLMSAWDESNANVKEILGLLRYGETPTKIDVLPAGHALMAEAAKGNGTANAMLARVLFKASLQHLLGREDITTDTERPMVVSVFNEVWYHLLGNRTALYQNEDAKKHGPLALVAVLDTADGQKFYDHMAELAKIADGKVKPGQGGVKVEELMKDLHSDDVRKQELAKLKLRLLGAAALPTLRKAADSNKAQELAEEIAKLAAERKQGLPAGSWFLRFRPTLQPQDKTEERAGMKVHVMKLHLPAQARDMAKQMEELFGPGWENVRFAVHGKNVVVLLGSNTDVLDQTLTNLKAGKSGLADAAAVKTFYQKSDKDRRVEFHFAVASVMALFDAGPAALPAPGKQATASLGMSVVEDPGTLQLDLWIPLSEARLLVKVLGF